MSNLPQVGIDIGSASIKVVELVPQGKTWKLMAAASMPTPSGGLPATVAGLTKLIKDAGIRVRRAVTAVPEEQVSSHVVEMPSMTDAEIEQALQWQVEQYIPIPENQAVWSYKVIKKDPSGGGMEVLLVAVAKDLVQSYQKIFEQSGLELVALETELMATARAILTPDSPLSVVVDIGSKTTDLGIVRGNDLVFARTIPTAGEAFTRALESGLNLDQAQAEQYKNTYGFSKTHLEGKLLEAMQPVLNIIASEIKKTIDFYVSKHAGEAVKIVVLSGGVAAMPDIVSILSPLVGLETILGNPFSRVTMDRAQATALTGNESFYAVAVGLAQRET
jgi:type IV pilus assembly protein PilM